jgi:hypothetical protein
MIQISSGIFIAIDETVQDIVAVCGYNQLLDG